MFSDLSPKEIQLLSRWCDWGVRVGEGHDYRGGELLRKVLLEPHPMGRWAFDLGIKEALGIKEERDKQGQVSRTSSQS